MRGSTGSFWGDLAAYALVGVILWVLGVIWQIITVRPKFTPSNLSLLFHAAQNDISEFHRELDSFDSKLQRLTSRVEEKTDGVVDEIRKLAGGTHDDLQDIQTSQTETRAAVKESRIAMKADIDSATQGVCTCVAKEGAVVTKGLGNAKDEICAEIRLTRKIVIASVVIAAFAVACAALLVVKSFAG